MLPQHADPGRCVILFVDSHPLSRECFARWIEASANEFEIRTAAESEADQSAGDIDILLLNVRERRANEIDVARTMHLFKQKFPAAPLIVLSDREDSIAVVEAIRHGAQGFVPTSFNLRQVIGALRFVATGGVFVPADAILGTAAQPQSMAQEDLGEAEHRLLESLTTRQREVIALVRQGKPNKIIAHELGMRESTVKVHIRNIMSKLRVTNRVQAAYFVQQRLDR